MSIAAPKSGPGSGRPSRCNRTRSRRQDAVAPKNTGGQAWGAGNSPVGHRPYRDDRDWVNRARRGDSEAAHGLVQRLYPTIVKSVRRHCPRRSNEEDLVQTVFLKIFKKLGQFSGHVPLEHWVLRITINTCLTQLRYEVVRPEWRMSDLREEEEIAIQKLSRARSDPPGSRAQAARELVEHLMTRLQPDERTIIHLFHLEDRSAKEISRLTGWSVSRIKVKAFRARHKMRRLYQSLAQERQETMA